MKVTIRPQQSNTNIHIKPQTDSMSANVTSGSVKSARKLETPRRIGLIGDIHGFNYFDGSADIDIHTNATIISNVEIEEMIANG